MKKDILGTEARLALRTHPSQTCRFLGRMATNRRMENLVELKGARVKIGPFDMEKDKTGWNIVLHVQV